MAMKAWLGGFGAVALVLALVQAFAPSAPPLMEAPPPPVGPALPWPAPPHLTVRAGAQPPASRVVGTPTDRDELERLIAAARQGDRQAAYVAYQRLSACATEAPPDACSRLPPSLVQERLRFLAEAAQAGVVGAQIDFYMEGPGALQSADDEALQAWREQAVGQLASAAGRCDVFAMGLLATLYDAGEMTQRNDARALAYAVAERQLRRRAPPSDAALRNRLAEPVDDAVLATARQQGQSLAAACL
jgi:hypothetical protein